MIYVVTISFCLKKKNTQTVSNSISALFFLNDLYILPSSSTQNSNFYLIQTPKIRTRFKSNINGESRGRRRTNPNNLYTPSPNHAFRANSRRVRLTIRLNRRVPHLPTRPRPLLLPPRSTRQRAARNRMVSRETIRSASDLQTLHQKLFRRTRFRDASGMHARRERDQWVTCEYF